MIHMAVIYDMALNYYIGSIYQHYQHTHQEPQQNPDEDISFTGINFNKTRK